MSDLDASNGNRGEPASRAHHGRTRRTQRILGQSPPWVPEKRSAGVQDLGRLEPDVLEVAAEMSQASRELATTYSDEKVARARAFLAARQEELACFEARIERALATCDEIRRHKGAVETEEAEHEMRLARMEAEFADILADLGYSRTGRSVVSLPPKGNFAAE